MVRRFWCLKALSCCITSWGVEAARPFRLKTVIVIIIIIEITIMLMDAKVMRYG